MTTFLMKLTEHELEAIYLLIERDPKPPEAFDLDHDSLQSVVEKIGYNKIGPNAHPSGAIGVLYED